MSKRVNNAKGIPSRNRGPLRRVRIVAAMKRARVNLRPVEIIKPKVKQPSFIRRMANAFLPKRFMHRHQAR